MFCADEFLSVWAFWLAQVWNFQTAAWGSYNVAMISEVVSPPSDPPRAILYLIVIRTSRYRHPRASCSSLSSPRSARPVDSSVRSLIASAIIDRAGGNTNYAYWFLFAMGSTGAIILWFVNPDKAKLDNARCKSRPMGCLKTTGWPIDADVKHQFSRRKRGICTMRISERGRFEQLAHRSYGDDVIPGRRWRACALRARGYELDVSVASGS